MKKAIFLRFLLILSIGLLLFGCIISPVFSSLFSRQEEQQLRSTLMLLEELFQPEDGLSPQAASLSELLEQQRVTILSDSGEILADSCVPKEKWRSQSQYPEIQAALRGEIGVAYHFSLSQNRSMAYAALQTDSGYLLRIAQPSMLFTSVLITQVSAFLIAFITASFFAFFLAARFTRRIVQPLEELADALSENKGPSAFRENRYPELAGIIYRINGLARSMKLTNRELSREREKIEFILNNLEEGLVLLDDKQNILTVSTSAKRFFGCTSELVGRHISWLVKDKRISDAVEDVSVSGSSRIFDYPVSDHLILSLHITQVKDDFIRRHEYAYGAIIMISDVTGERKAQQMRQEFFSNASHELKTPITSIRGFAELLSAGIVVSPQQQESYLGRIITETDRMTGLLNDILMISNLESGEREQNQEFVDLTQLCADAIATLSPQMEKKNLSLSCSSEPVLFFSEKNQMYELLVNIISNAVKYNRQNGRVDISLKDLGSKVSIKVKDTGIGIPPEAQPRIFERFYRVDKGRSRTLGGTGLGLSIVKHIVNQYEGEITLQSREGEGTVILIDLPKRRNTIASS